MARNLSVWVSAVCLALLAACGSDSSSDKDSSGGANAASIPSKPEPGQIRLGTDPWIGYGPWAIADKKGYFNDEGLDVKIVNFHDPNNLDSAYAAGKVDAASEPTNRVFKLVSAGVGGVVPLALDTSHGADAIIASKSVPSIQDLKGKRVGYQEGSTADLLVRAALKQAGLTIDDIEHVEIAPDAGGSALARGSIDAVSSYEPYNSTITREQPQFKSIFDSKQAPGVVSDVLAVTDGMANDKPGQVAALVRAWNKAIAFLESNPREGRAIIAEFLGASPQSLATTFETVEFYGEDDQRRLFVEGEITKLMNDVYGLSKEAGLVSGDVSVSDVVDARFARAAAGH